MAAEGASHTTTLGTSWETGGIRPSWSQPPVSVPLLILDVLSGSPGDFYRKAWLADRPVPLSQCRSHKALVELERAEFLNSSTIIILAETITITLTCVFSSL